MSCQHILTRGKNKGTKCPKINCKRHNIVKSDVMTRNKPLIIVMSYYEEKDSFKQCLLDAYSNYTKFGSRSSKKTDIIHNHICNVINKTSNRYYAKTEQNVKCSNHSKRKKHDIVVYDKVTDNIVYIFPIKFIMSNYNQNKNNYLENLVGESYLTKKANPYIQIIPINIIFNKIPYFKKDKTISKIENFEMEIIQTYNSLCNKDIFDKCVFYVINYDDANKKLVENDLFVNTFTDIQSLLN